MQTTRLKITGMSCQSCVAHTKKALEAVPGVGSVEVTLEPPVAVVKHDAVPEGKLIAAVEDEGYAVLAGD
jgi:copper chaperone CopZ